MRDYNIVSKYKMNSQQTGGGHVTVNEGPFPNEETWPSGSCLGPWLIYVSFENDLRPYVLTESDKNDQIKDNK